MDQELIKPLGNALLRIRRAGNALTAQLPLSLPELNALSLLMHNREDSDANVFASDLTLKLNASKAAVSQMIASLEKRGYVKRAFNLSNRRKIIVMLTDKGLDVVHSVQSRFDSLMRGIIDQFGEANTRKLIELMEQLDEVIEARTDIDNA